ncbi:phosphate ABC transporter permease subunit PstC [Demetria terragena]|uniref:phosphate ABC transporter permease subunit PstC n=1 Tax=Demetria terragena TaxID=63959 RepID=UPI0003660539|nr:phosphate ABC transporter permease subunit PstC [Demetria terragena]
MASISGVSTSDETPPSDDPIGGSEPKGQLGDRLFGGAAMGAGIVVIALVTLIGVFLVITALPALTQNDANFFTSTEWQVSGDTLSFGIARLLWVTVISSLLALGIAVPLAVAIALFLTHYAPRPVAKPAAALVDLLAAVPSIVYGLWGGYIVGQHFEPVNDAITATLGWFPLFKDEGSSPGSTILFVSIILAIMILPIITALSREVFAQTPTTHMEGALALGATKWEMIRTAVLPFGKPGVISAAMLGLGRALGETVAVMIIVSALFEGAPWSWSVLYGGETFASKIANNAGEMDTATKTGAYIAAGLVLFLLTFIVNAIARIIIERRKAFTE